MDTDKIPVEKVIDDMYNPDGGMVSLSARDYYYENYATKEEKKIMDEHDRIHRNLLVMLGILLIALVLICVFRDIL